MHYLFYGPDNFRIAEKVNEIRQRFLASDQSGINLDIIDGESLTFERFDQAISTLPFLADKRLVIIKNFLVGNKNKETFEKVDEKLFGKKSSEKDQDHVVIIFSEFGEPDKRSRLFKHLNLPKRSHYFELLKDLKLENWIREQFSENEIKIQPQALQKLIFSLGGDLFQQKNEINKIILYVKSQGRGEVNIQDIENLVKDESEANIFQLIEDISSNRTKSAQELLYKFLSSGENEQYIFSMIVYQFRNLLTISDLLEAKEEKFSIAKKAKLHPFVVQKSLGILKKYSFQKLVKVFEYLTLLDVKIKSGRIDPVVGLNLLLVEINDI